MSEQNIKLTAFLTQGLSSLTIAITTFQIGLLAAWPSSTLENFTSNSTVLSSPMTTIHISLFGSLPSVGAIFATPLCGLALRRIGRKYSTMLFATWFVIAWTIMALTTYVSLILVAMCIGGLGSAGYATSTIYISEISQNSVRGAFTTLSVMYYLIGLQVSYFMAGYMTYYQMIYACLSLSIIYIFVIGIMKDSPVYLLQNGLEEEAAKSIAFYRCVDVRSAEVNTEINKLKLQLNVNTELRMKNEDGTTEDLLKHRPREMISKTHSEWKYLMKSESSKRALVTSLTLMVTSLMMGILVVHIYAEPLFKDAVPSMDANKCAVYLGFDFIIGTILFAVLVDSFGRKTMLTVSSSATGICALLLGLQLLLHWAPPWCTVLLIFLYSFAYSLGAGNVPFILASEVFLPEVRGLCNSIAMTTMSLTSFVSIFMFHPIAEAVGLGITFCGFSVICFISALYGLVYFPETKGLSADEIQLLFIKKKNNRPQ